MSEPLVSWLLPVYNGEKYIRRALDSMINQTYQNFELVIILENVCTDRSAAICEEYAQIDKRVHVHYKIGAPGVAASLNQGINNCMGKYIARMDADDFSYPERLEKQVAFMEKNSDVGILATNALIKNKCSSIEKYKETVPDSEEIRARLLFDNCITHPTVMFRAKIFHEDGIRYPLCPAEDYALWTSVISKVKMCILPDILLEYYNHGENTCATNFTTIRSDSAIISKKAIYNELGIETNGYSYNFFGWRSFDSIMRDNEDFLIEGFTLFRKIQEVNNIKGRFGLVAMEKALEFEWKKTLGIVGFYGEAGSFNRPFHELDIKDITDGFKYINEQIPKLIGKRIIIYGVGKYCEKLMQDLQDDYPFEIVVFCDSSTDKQGTSFYNTLVISPQKIANYEYDYIYIASPIYKEEIKDMLLNEYKIDQEAILDMPLGAIASRFRKNAYLEKYKDIKTSSKVCLFCGADYGNLGDHAIAAAEHKYFSEYFGIPLAEVSYNRFNEVIPIIQAHLMPGDIILITGGGFLGSLWEHAEFQVREIVSLFSNNPILILPQTLYWADEEKWRIEREHTRQVYESHGNVVLCARDAVTYNLMREAYPKCKVITAPDMVLSIGWDEYIEEDTQRKGALLCLKTDKESILSSDDWVSLKEIASEVCGRAEIVSTNLEEMVSEKRRKSFLKKILNEFSHAEVVITDRLHGLLFSIITGTPCVALNNCNHKLYSTFEWVKHVLNVRFADSIEMVDTLAREVISIGVKAYNYYEFKKDFEELEAIIRDLINRKEAREEL